MMKTVKRAIAIGLAAMGTAAVPAVAASASTSGPISLDRVTRVECPAAIRIIGDPIRNEQTCQFTVRTDGDTRGELAITGYRGDEYWYQVNDGVILTLGYTTSGHAIRFTIPRNSRDITIIGDRSSRPYDITVVTSR
jgi:hypothetical protein